MKQPIRFFSWSVLGVAVVSLVLLGRSILPVLWAFPSRLPTTRPSSLSVEHTPLIKRILSHPANAPIPAEIQQHIAAWVRDGARRLPFYKEITPKLRANCARCHNEEALDFRRWQAAARLPKPIRPYTWPAVFHAQSIWLAWVWWLGALLWLFPIVPNGWKHAAVGIPLVWVLGLAWMAQQLSPYTVPRLLQIAGGGLLVWGIVVVIRLILAVYRPSPKRQEPVG